MDKKAVKEFFNGLAESWDRDMIRNDEKINEILDIADIKEGVSVLDVACGTGVLVNDYLERKVRKVLGVDISEKMIKVAESKFGANPSVEFLCGDIEEIFISEKFDRCVVYNAFPHFPNPHTLIAALSEKLCEGARLTIAHGMSRKAIDEHHKGCALKVSMGLMDENELAEIMSAYFKVDAAVSDEGKYVVSGIKR